LTIALDGAPYGPGVDEAKVSSTIYPTFTHLLKKSQNLTLQSVVSILNSTISTEIPNVVRSLSQDAQDTLMKYLYKGMGLPGWGDVSGSVLLGWHEKVRSHLDHFIPFFSLT
jgi:actin related protein 2/3 complex subunit 5